MTILSLPFMLNLVGNMPNLMRKRYSVYKGNGSIQNMYMRCYLVNTIKMTSKTAFYNTNMAVLNSGSNTSTSSDLKYGKTKHEHGEQNSGTFESHCSRKA